MPQLSSSTSQKETGKVTAVGDIAKTEDIEPICIEPGRKHEFCDNMNYKLFGSEIFPFSGPDRSHLSKDLENLVSVNDKPKYPHLSDFETRLKSYETWPKGEIVSPEKLAEAGFYFTKIHDYAVCFFCNGGLKNWDKSSDPWVDHAAHFSKCGFVNMHKDEKFIQDAIRKKKPILSADNIKELINSLETLKTNESSKVVEENGIEKNVEFGNIAEGGATSSTLKTNTSRCCFKHSNRLDTNLCRICYEKDRAILFQPCGHIVACKSCTTSLAVCPVCRKEYTGVIRVYL